MHLQRLTIATLFTLAVPAAAWSSKRLPYFDSVHRNAVEKVLDARGVAPFLRDIAENQQMNDRRLWE